MIELFKKYSNLQLAYIFLLKNNNGNANTYHGINHLLTVTKKTWEILCSMHSQYYIDIILNEEELLIAAIFHDFNHTGKLGPDSVNIQLAVDGVNEFIAVSNLSDSLNIDIIIDTLKATEFPYKNIPNNILECIIRDADMSYLYDDINFLSFSNFGLGKEYDKYDNNENILAWLKGQLKFVETTECFTEYSKKNWNKRKLELVSLMENIISDWNKV